MPPPADAWGDGVLPAPLAAAAEQQCGGGGGGLVTEVPAAAMSPATFFTQYYLPGHVADDRTADAHSAHPHTRRDAPMC